MDYFLKLPFDEVTFHILMQTNNLSLKMVHDLHGHCHPGIFLVRTESHCVFNAGFELSL